MKSKLMLFGLMLCGVWSEMNAQDTVFRFSGKVTDKSGRGIAGVVVNNGMDFTKTDAKGMWALQTDTTQSKFVSISTPAAYVLPQREGLADGFYVSVGKLAAANGKHDFVIEKRSKMADGFHYIVISDPQVRNAHEMKRWRQETVEDLTVLIDSLKPSKEVVGMTLGDLVFDQMQLFDEYKASLDNFLPVHWKP